MLTPIAARTKVRLDNGFPAADSAMGRAVMRSPGSDAFRCGRWMGRQGKWNVFRVQTHETGGEMYRIRLPSGEQAVFRSVEELTLAVQSGVVGPTAEVYLPDANRWMQMESHPDFQAARIKPASAESPAAPPQPVTQPPVSLAPIPLGETTAPPSPAPSGTASSRGSCR